MPLENPHSTPVIHVVDDDAGMRKAVRQLLEAAGYAARCYASAGDFLIAERDDGPGCVLLDLKMPGPDGLALQKALAQRGDALPIIFLTGHADVQSTIEALKAGASDFLTKPVGRDTLLAAVEQALATDAARRADRDELNVLRARYATLTPREREVLDHVIAGRLNKQIANDVGAAERTVKAHRAQVMQKMQARSLADLVRTAARLGLPRPAPRADA